MAKYDIPSGLSVIPNNQHNLSIMPYKAIRCLRRVFNATQDLGLGEADFIDLLDERPLTNTSMTSLRAWQRKRYSKKRNIENIENEQGKNYHSKTYIISRIACRKIREKQDS